MSPLVVSSMIRFQTSLRVVSNVTSCTLKKGFFQDVSGGNERVQGSLLESMGTCRGYMDLIKV